MVDVLHQGMGIWRISDDARFLNLNVNFGPLCFGLLQKIGDPSCHVRLFLLLLLLLHPLECIHFKRCIGIVIDSSLVLFDHMLGELIIIDVGFAEANIAILAFGNHTR